MTERGGIKKDSQLDFTVENIIITQLENKIKHHYKMIEKHKKLIEGYNTHIKEMKDFINLKNGIKTKI